MGRSALTTTQAIQHLEERGILSKITGGKYARTYVYQAYLTILNEED